MSDEQLAKILNEINFAIISLSQSSNGVPIIVIRDVIEHLKEARGILVDGKFPLGEPPQYLRPTAA